MYENPAVPPHRPELVGDYLGVGCFFLRERNPSRHRYPFFSLIDGTGRNRTWQWDRYSQINHFSGGRATVRRDDRMGLLCAKLACKMVGDSMLDFVYPDVAGFFSDSEGSIYDAAFYYGATDCLRFVCQEGFERNHEALLSIAARAYGLIDDLSLQSPNYLPVAVVLEAYLREMVRRYGLAASKAHVTTPGGDGLICHRALLMLGVIEDELARGASSQPDSTSTSESFTAQS